MIVRPVVVFPQPLSPTRPKTSPFLIKKLTSSTALVTAGPLLKYCFRCSTRSSTSGSSSIPAVSRSASSRLLIIQRISRLRISSRTPMAKIVAYFAATAQKKPITGIFRRLSASLITKFLRYNSSHFEMETLVSAFASARSASLTAPQLPSKLSSPRISGNT